MLNDDSLTPAELQMLDNDNSPSAVTVTGNLIIYHLGELSDAQFALVQKHQQYVKSLTTY